MQEDVSFPMNAEEIDVVKYLTILVINSKIKMADICRYDYFA